MFFIRRQISLSSTCNLSCSNLYEHKEIIYITLLWIAHNGTAWGGFMWQTDGNRSRYTASNWLSTKALFFLTQQYYSMHLLTRSTRRVQTFFANEVMKKQRVHALGQSIIQYCLNQTANIIYAKFYPMCNQTMVFPWYFGQNFNNVDALMEDP